MKKAFWFLSGILFLVAAGPCGLPEPTPIPTPAPQPSPACKPLVAIRVKLDADPKKADGKSWATAFADLTSAIGPALKLPKDKNGRGLIAIGQYGLNVSKPIMLENIHNLEVRGNYRGKTECEDDFAESDDPQQTRLSSNGSARHIIHIRYNDGMPANLILTNLGIAGGKAVVENEDWEQGPSAENSGGGILIEGGDNSLVMQKMHFLFNQAKFGGAIALFGASPTIRQIYFELNASERTLEPHIGEYGAIFGTSDSHPVLENNYFSPK